MVLVLFSMIDGCSLHEIWLMVDGCMKFGYMIVGCWYVWILKLFWFVNGWHGGSSFLVVWICDSVFGFFGYLFCSFGFVWLHGSSFGFVWLRGSWFVWLRGSISYLANSRFTIVSLGGMLTYIILLLLDSFIIVIVSLLG